MSNPAKAALRGPEDHAVRDEIIAAASEHFRQYGYGKTTVSDLARAIGFSKAYIYKFFESKQAIGEAICRSCLATIIASAEEVMSRPISASEKLRQVFAAIVATSTDLFVHDRRLFDVTAHAATERWSSIDAHKESIIAVIACVIEEGRQAGEFEKETPSGDVVRSIFHAMKSFIIPPMLVHNLDEVHEGMDDVMALVLRSLRPRQPLGNGD